MFIRKLYLKIRLFLYSIRNILNRIAIILMIGTLIYLFINVLIFKNLIIGKANNYEINQKYEKAITFYNIAYSYYSFNHISTENKEIYLELPYSISTNYLKIKDKKQAVQNMFDGIAAIQTRYGVYSKENADFTRKYLIEFLLTNNNVKFAEVEFKNLINIYKKIGYSETIVPDLIRLKGDLYYAQGNYDTAINLYEQAYNKIITLTNIDYNIFTNIVNKICEYEIKTNNNDMAIDIYNNSINILENSTEKNSDMMAEMLIDLGDLYAKKDISTKQAIKCYEKAITIVKKLPRSNYMRENIKNYLLTLQDLYNKNGQFHKVDEIDIELARQRRFSFLFQ